MSFLYRKYMKDENGGPVSQSPAQDVVQEETQPVPPLEFKLWPPSPKAQIILIAVAFFVFNLILIGIWAVVLIQHT